MNAVVVRALAEWTGAVPPNTGLRNLLQPVWDLLAQRFN